MRVLLVSNFYPPYSRGGSESVAQMSAVALRELGHDVVVLTMQPGTSLRALWPRRTIEEGLRVYRWLPLNFYFLAAAHRYPFIFRFLWTMWDLVNPVALLAAWSVLRREKPEIVISHNIKGMGMLLPRLLAAQTARYVHVIHDVQLVEPSGILYPTKLDERTQLLPIRLYAGYLRWCFATLRYVVSPSSYLLDFYRQRNFFTKAKTQIILNPVARVQYMRRQHQGIEVLYLGLLEQHKGFSALIEAWQKLEGDEYRLTIIGDGTLSHQARALAERDNRVRVRGRLTGKALEKAWEDIDLVVVPSLCVENSPMVIMEAMARQVPVVATDVGGIPELASLWSGVITVPSAQPEALKEAILVMVNRIREHSIPPAPAVSDARSYVASLIAVTG